MTFKAGEKSPVWKRMKNTETKAKINMDEPPLGALHKVPAHTHTHTQTPKHPYRGAGTGASFFFRSFLFSDGHTSKVLLNVMMCKMRKTSPWQKGGRSETESNELSA